MFCLIKDQTSLFVGRLSDESMPSCRAPPSRWKNCEDVIARQTVDDDKDEVIARRPGNDDSDDVPLNEMIDVIQNQHIVRTRRYALYTSLMSSVSRLEK